MPAGCLLGDEAFRRILRTQIAHVELDERIALFEKPGVIPAFLPRQVWTKLSLPSLRAPSSRRFSR